MPDFKFQDSYKEKKNNNNKNKQKKNQSKYHWVNYDYIGLSSY